MIWFICFFLDPKIGFPAAGNSGKHMPEWWSCYFLVGEIRERQVPHWTFSNQHYSLVTWHSDIAMENGPFKNGMSKAWRRDPRRSGLHSLWHPMKICDISHNTNMPELSPDNPSYQPLHRDKQPTSTDHLPGSTWPLPVEVVGSLLLVQQTNLPTF
jgi:hypothetical protein